MNIKFSVIKKISLLIALFILLFNLISLNNVYAEDDPGLETIITTMNGTSNPNIATDDGILGTINKVIGFIQIAGSGISIVVISIVGIKYILASPQEKADLKKTAVPIVIGCVLLFGAVNIVGIIEKFSSVLKT